MTDQRHAALGIHPIAGDEDGGPDHLPRRRQIVRSTRIAVLLVLALLAIGAARTVYVRVANARALEAGTAERATQYVKTALPQTAGSGQTLALPGTLQGFTQSPISARASGYLKRWTRDIGSRVEEGRAAGRDRDARDRPAALAGGRGAPAGGRRARTREEHAGALGGPAQEGRGLAAGPRRDAAAPWRRPAPIWRRPTPTSQRLRQTEGFKRVLAPFAGVITGATSTSAT